MDVVFGWLFVSTFLSKVIQIESGFEALVGTFRVLRKHPQLQQCAAKTLQKHEYVGARISDQTGVCEGLSKSWGRNQTIESGYGYAVNIHVRINYEPNKRSPIILDIPGVLNNGAKLDIHLTWIKMTIQGCRVYCSVVEYKPNTSGRVVGEDRTEYDFLRPQEFATSNQWKISFVAQRNTLILLVDDQVVSTMNLTSIRLNYVEGFGLSTSHDPTNTDPEVRIRIMEFTEA